MIDDLTASNDGDLSQLRDVAKAMAEVYSANGPTPLLGGAKKAFVAVLLDQLKVGWDTSRSLRQLGEYVGSAILKFEEERGLPPGPKRFVVAETGVVQGVA